MSSILRRLPVVSVIPFALALAWSAACGGSGTTPDAGTEDDASWPHEDAAWPHEDASATDATTGDASRDATEGDTSDDGATADGAASDGGSDATSDAATGDASSDGSTSDGSTSDASDAAIRIDDPFDPRSCDGPAIDAATALAKLGALPRTKLADTILYRRDRTCTGSDPATCGAWGAPVSHSQPFLTYSGGVVTDYKTFSFPTHLVLYVQAGQPRFSVRHASDYQHDANASARGVSFAFGATPMVNTYPIIYVWDFAPAPNRYEDLQGLLGSRAELHATATCARLYATSGITREIVGLYRY